MAGFGEFANRLLGNTVNTASNATNKILNTPLQQKDGSKNQPQTIGDFLQAIQQKRPAAQPQQPAANEAPAYIAPQATPQTVAPASQEKKESDSKKDQERKSFNDTVARMIPNALINDAGMMLTNATAPEEAEAADAKEGGDQEERVAPSVETRGSSSNLESILRNAMGDNAYEQLQEGMKAGEKRQADRKAEEKQREEDYQYMIGASPQAQLDRAKLEQEIAAASAQQDRDLLLAGVDDPQAKDRYEASLAQSSALVNDALNDQIEKLTEQADAALEGASGKKGPGKPGEEDEAVDPNQLYYGLTRDQINQMYEDAIYNAAMEDQAYRRLFNDAGYGDLYGSYAAYGSLGDTTDYSSRRDVTRDIFGLGGSNPDLEIQGLKDIYLENGTINKDMTDDEMLDAILEAHWGAGNIINPYQWMSDEAYQAANPFGGSSAGQGYADYWLENGVIPVDESGVFGGLEGDWSKLDNEDFSALVAAGNIINQLNAGWRPTDADMGAMSQVFQNAGDLSSFAYLPTDNSESEYKGREWNANQRANAYAMAQLLQAMAAAEGGDYSGLTPYVDSNMALGDAYMTDTVAKAIENSTGKKVGRKDR